MGFMLEQQARFDVRLDQLPDSQATLTASVLRIAEFVEDLTQAQKTTDERLRQTDERLNALINVVEKHVTGPDHGRKPQ